MRKRWQLAAITLILSVLALGSSAYANTTDTTTYGSGTYGGCDYGACSITLASSGTVADNVVPTASGKCTVQSDTVSVLTDNAAGYTVTMTTSTTSNALANGSSLITASGGTAAVPATLANNTWGYRIDGISGFGAGPTSAQSSGGTPSVRFAGVPASNQTAATVSSASGPADPAVNTTVWYGVCTNTSLPSGNYSTSITYTAVTN